MGGRGQTDRGSIVPSQCRLIQDMGGRVTRYPLRARRRPNPATFRDVQLGERWMDAMSVDYSCLFPTGMLNIGLHPQKEMEVELCWAYNRWLTEKVLPESRRPLLLDAVPAVLRSRRLRCARSRRSATAKASPASWSRPCAHLPVHDNSYMKVYRAIEERGLVARRSTPGRTGASRSSSACNRFLSVHALGFTFYNILH